MEKIEISCKKYKKQDHIYDEARKCFSSLEKCRLCQVAWRELNAGGTRGRMNFFQGELTARRQKPLIEQFRASFQMGWDGTPGDTGRGRASCHPQVVTVTGCVHCPLYSVLFVVCSSGKLSWQWSGQTFWLSCYDWPLNLFSLRAKRGHCCLKGRRLHFANHLIDKNTI